MPVMNRDRNWSDCDVEIDDQEFHCCTFHNCRMVFRGGGHVVFEACAFSGQTVFMLDGAAAATANFLREMRAVPGGKQVVEGMLGFGIVGD